jgi:class 3 adenylate cyclase/TolB-like protein
VNALLHRNTTSSRTGAPAPLLRTLVLCDLADSTALVERLGDLHAAELFRRHDRLARTLVHQFGGREIDKTDGFLMMFDRPIEAVAFALAYQRALGQLDVRGATLRARVGIHFGDVVAWDNSPEDIAKGAKPYEVEGLVKPTTSRLMQLALPGQILLSGVAYQLAHRAHEELGDAAATALWRTHGRYRFKGLPDPVAVFEVGEHDIAPLRAPPWSGKAHRETPFWRRPATLVVECAVLLALVALPLWYLLRPEPAIAFAQRDWIIVGSLKNLTDDTTFDDSLATAFRLGLGQSRYVNVLSDLKTRETVKLMQRDPDHTDVDRAIGSEVAIRDGARALVLPTVAEIGGRVRVTAEVVDPSTQTTVWSESADGIGAESVLPSLDKVNQKLRVRLGEALATVSNDSRPLEKVATKNLDALRAFSIREFDAAMASRDHLPPRDMLYVEALRATFGAPRPALEKWKMLTSLYPDFFAGQGAYGFFVWEQSNDYAQAIESAKLGASERNAHRATSQYLLGTLYLGSERYDDALREFELVNAVAGTPIGFHVAALAATRRFKDIDPLFERANVPADDPSARMQRAYYAMDQGRWSESREMLATTIAQPKMSADFVRMGRLVDFSLAAIEGKSEAFSKAGRDLLKAEQALPASTSGAEKSDRAFRLLAIAYLAAKAGDIELAHAALAAAGPEARSEDYPIPLNLADVAESQIAIAEKRPADAIAKLAKYGDGRELYVTHVARMEAYAASGDSAKALDEADWLASHRGRAYTEYGSEWVLTAYNVAESNLALLRASKFAHDAGQGARSQKARTQFLAAWPDAAKIPFLATDLAAAKD